MSRSTTINIGELAARVKSADLTAEVFDTAIASDFEVEVEYDYRPANVEQDQAAEVRINAIRATSPVHFEGTYSSTIVRRGVDLMPLFSHHAISELADAILMEELDGEE
jgi:hypothetical protein